jgi:ProP effector
MKIGICQDVVAACPDLDPKLVKLALATYCNHGSYYDCLTPGTVRVDLNGEPAGVVAENEVRRPKTASSQSMAFTLAHLSP